MTRQTSGGRIEQQNVVTEQVVHNRQRSHTTRLAAILIIVFAQRPEDIVRLTWRTASRSPPTPSLWTSPACLSNFRHLSTRRAWPSATTTTKRRHIARLAAVDLSEDCLVDISPVGCSSARPLQGAQQVLIPTLLKKINPMQSSASWYDALF